MKLLIACCGLDCETCDVRVATVNHDEALREKTAKLWSELNGCEIPKEALYCLGCRGDGVKCAYCEAMCAIRKCAVEKGCATCGDCMQTEACELIRPILAGHPEALGNLRG